MAKKKAVRATPELTGSEQDLLSNMAKGYQLETDSLGGNLVLRRLKDDEAVRLADANASTIKSLEKQGLIRPDKGSAPLTIVWRLSRGGK